MPRRSSQEGQPNSAQSPAHHRSPSSPAQTSLPSLNPETARKSLNERTLQKLMELNREYLNEKVRVGDVRKPSRYGYKLPSKTGHSEYSRIFRSLPADELEGSTPSRSKMANDLRLPGSGITNYQSTYNTEFPQRRQEQLLQRQRPAQYERQEGPFFAETSYHRAYRPRGSSPQEGAVTPGSHIATGGKFSESTTYAQHYPACAPAAPPVPVRHKDHSIFVKIGKPRQSSYQLSYLPQGPQRVEDSCKPTTRAPPVVARIKYRTEYSEKYVQQAGTDRAEFQCLSSEQLKSYVLGILHQ